MTLIEYIIENNDVYLDKLNLDTYYIGFEDTKIIKNSIEMDPFNKKFNKSENYYDISSKDIQSYRFSPIYNKYNKFLIEKKTFIDNFIDFVQKFNFNIDDEDLTNLMVSSLYAFLDDKKNYIFDIFKEKKIMDSFIKNPLLFELNDFYLIYIIYIDYLLKNKTNVNDVDETMKKIGFKSVNLYLLNSLFYQLNNCEIKILQETKNKIIDEQKSLQAQIKEYLYLSIEIDLSEYLKKSYLNLHNLESLKEYKYRLDKKFNINILNYKMDDNLFIVDLKIKEENKKKAIYIINEISKFLVFNEEQSIDVFFEKQVLENQIKNKKCIKNANISKI